MRDCKGDTVSLRDVIGLRSRLDVIKDYGEIRDDYGTDIYGILKRLYENGVISKMELEQVENKICKEKEYYIT